MRSSNRQPRYRRRFLTRTHNLRKLLLRLQPEYQRDGYRPDSYSTFQLLLRSACVKSASEIDASPDGKHRAVSHAIERLPKLGVEYSPLSLEFRD